MGMHLWIDFWHPGNNHYNLSVQPLLLSSGKTCAGGSSDSCTNPFLYYIVCACIDSLLPSGCPDSYPSVPYLGSYSVHSSYLREQLKCRHRC